MKEGFQSLMNLLSKVNCPPEWLEHLSQAFIGKVVVNTKKRSWVIHIHTIELLPPEIWEGLQQKLKSGLESLQHVAVCLHYDRVETEMVLQKYWYWIQKCIEEDLGLSSAGWLRKATWKVNQNILEIGFPHRTLLQMAKQKELDRAIEKYYKRITGREVVVCLGCQVDEEKKSKIMAEREEQERQLLEKAMTEQQAPVKGSQVSGAKKDVAKRIGSSFQGEAVSISSIQKEEKNVIIRGEVFKCETRELRTGRLLFMFHLTDFSDSIQCKIFARNDEQAAMFSRIQPKDWLRVRGSVQFDRFSRDYVVIVQDLEEISPQVRQDTAKEKRVELHLHTSMSAMDGVCHVKDLVKRAADWGHPAIAITDHGVAQAYPEAYEAGKKHGVKVLFGMEANVVDDGVTIVDRATDSDLLKDSYVVFDVETTGLSVTRDTIIELAAVKMIGGEIVDRFESFARANRRISHRTVELTGITDDMLRDAPEVDEVIRRFMVFCEGTTLVAHNARFDMGFLQEALRKLGEKPACHPVIDTLEMARLLYPGMKNYRLNILASRFGVHLEQHHRAVYDAEATAHILWKLLLDAHKAGMKTTEQLNCHQKERDFTRQRPFHVVLLVQNETGLKNLYKLISLSHLEHFYRVPRIPKSLLVSHRKGLLVGSGCERGELFEAALLKSREEAERIAEFYDYIEIQPTEVNRHLIERGVVEEEGHLVETEKLLVEIAEKLGKPAVATANVHYLDEQQAVYRDILVRSQTGGRMTGSLSKAHYRTTEEMLQAFSHLGEEKAREVVITNPRQIADSLEALKPFPDGTFTPVMEGADEEIERLSYEMAHHWYGDPLPELVKQRIDKELGAIIRHGFSNLYLISQKIVAKSLQDGFIVGSRGSVGSSLIAALTQISEVNPLPPHYRCPDCKQSEFFTDGSYESGFDLPAKKCPTCDIWMHKDGQDIAFETFLGFEGDKTPDIDLNFASEYQMRAHLYTEELFGKDHIFRAGTISTIKDKTAYGFVKKYEEEKNLRLRGAEIERLVTGCAGVRRTTGQHPGGLMVVPQGKEIYDFTPIQRPADDSTSEVITTHFDYRSISGRILKLDILGHTAPSILKMLHDMTGVDPTTIACDDPKVLSIFGGTEVLGITPEDINGITLGTLGIPEFGTVFARGILEETRPTTVSELTRISGLSHGTDVWAGNAQELIRAKTCKLTDAICNRDDIMSYLIQCGLPEKTSFTIMEKVRKGKGLTDDEVELMKKHQVPNWYIDSCIKIKYLFPRAHAAAYVIMAIRIAYFKVYYPAEFYASLFSKSIKDFDIQEILKGYGTIKKHVQEIMEKGYQATPKEKGFLMVLELVQEMMARGITFKPVDLYRSQAVQFVVEDGQLLPPFAAISGVGENVAYGIVKAREEKEFLSIDDFQKRSRASSTIVEALRKMGSLQGLSEKNQLSLFLG